MALIAFLDVTAIYAITLGEEQSTHPAREW
jgi:hypothetical protein